MIYEGNTIEMLSQLINTPVYCLAMDFLGASEEARQKMQGGFPITREIFGELRTHYYILYEKNCISSPSLIKAYWNADYHVVYFKLPYENFIRTGINPFVHLRDVVCLGVHTHDSWYATNTTNPPIFDGIYTYAPWAWMEARVNLNTNSPILNSILEQYGSIREAMSQSQTSSSGSSSLSEASLSQNSQENNLSILEKQSESPQKEPVSPSVSDSSNSSSNSSSDSSSNSHQPGENVVTRPEVVIVKKAYGENIEQSWEILKGCDWEKAEKQDMLKRKLEKYLEGWNNVEINKTSSQEPLDTSNQTYPNKRRKT